jgi:dolichyl-phosphate beta-glucosyltransferase
MNDESNNQSFQHWISNQSNGSTKTFLTVIIPAYNEESRLPLTLMELVTVLSSRKEKFEIIVVDDGSKDTTSSLVQALSKIRSEVRVIRLPKNYGKGHAVRTGALSAQGEYVLFCDADGSTPWSELDSLFNALTVSKAEVAFGSRALLSKNTSIKARSYRKLMGRVFSFFVKRFAALPIEDTQCGFKLFTAKAAKFLFEKVTLDRFAFDVEILYIAQKTGVPFVEVPVNWHHVSGSKVNVIFDSIQMLKDISLLKFKHRKLEPGSWAKIGTTTN